MHPSLLTLFNLLNEIGTLPLSKDVPIKFSLAKPDDPFSFTEKVRLKSRLNSRLFRHSSVFRSNNNELLNDSSTNISYSKNFKRNND